MGCALVKSSLFVSMTFNGGFDESGFPSEKQEATVLPWTDSVGESLVAYLRSARPGLSYREVFLRCRAPAGPLKPTAVTEAFQLWTMRSGLNMPVQGPHCLRHSYALHLLRQGVSLKVLGDLLGHRNAESTSVYVRLSTEDLRDVALDLPDGCGLIHTRGGSL